MITILDQMNKNFGESIKSLINPNDQEKSQNLVKEFLENASKLKIKFKMEEINLPENNNTLKKEIQELEEELKRKDQLIVKNLKNLKEWKKRMEEMNKNQKVLQNEAN